jgi:hypothetical protein
MQLSPEVIQPILDRGPLAILEGRREQFDALREPLEGCHRWRASQRPVGIPSKVSDGLSEPSWIR